jgi:hypothetical protein
MDSLIVRVLGDGDWHPAVELDDPRLGVPLEAALHALESDGWTVEREEDCRCAWYRLSRTDASLMMLERLLCEKNAALASAA